MANNTDTTTKFKVDISELKANFQEAQRQIRLANSEFKAATAGMDSWGKSADGISAKIIQLNKVVDAEKTKLKSLEEQYKLVVKEQGEDSKGAQELMIKINNQKAAIGNTEKQIRTYTSQLDAMQNETDQTTKSTSKLDDELDKTKSASSKAGDGFTVLKGIMVNLVSAGIQAAIQGFKDLTAAAKEAYDEYDKGRDNLIKATGATGEAADELSGIYTKVSKQVVGDMNDIGSAIGEVNTRFGVNGDELEDLSVQYLKFADITGENVVSAVDETQKAMNAYGVEMQDTEKFLDLLAKTSQDTGIKTSKLTSGIIKNATAFQEMGLSVDQAVVFMGQLEKSGANSETVLNGMRKALKNSAANGLDLSESLTELQRSIENGTDGVDGLNAAYELFGKSGDQIYGAIKAGSISFEDLAKASVNAEGAVSKTYEETQSGADKVKLAMQSIKVTAGEATSALVEEFAPKIEEFLGVIERLIKGDKDAMKDLQENVQKIIKGISDKITDVLPMITGLLGTIIRAIINMILQNTPIIIKTILDVANQIIDTVVDVIPMLVSSLLNEVPQLINGITEIVTKLITSIGKLLPKIVNNVILVVPKIIDALLKAAPELLQAAITFLTEIVNAIPAIVKKLAEALPQIINTIVTSLNSFIPQLIQGTITLLMAIVDAIPLILPPLIEALPQIIAGIVNLFTESIPILVEASIQLFMAIIQAIPVIIEQLMPQIPMIIAAVIDALIANAPLLLEAAVTVFMEIANAIPMILDALWEGLTTTFQAVVDNLLEAFVENWLAGWEILKEHFEPIMKFFQNLINRIKNTAEKAIKTVKDKLDAAWRAVKKVWETVASFFEGVWNCIKNAFASADTWFSSKFKAAWDAIEKVWNKVKGYFKNIWTSIINVFTGKDETKDTESFFKTIFTNAWNNVKAVWDKVTNYFKNIWSNIIDLFTGKGKDKLQSTENFFKTIFTNAWKNITAIWDKVKGYFENIWKNIRGAFDGSGGDKSVTYFFKSTFDNAKTAVENIWNKAKGYFSGVWSNITDVFTGKNQNLEGVKTFFRNTFDDAKSAVETVWDKSKGYFEGVKSKITGVFSGSEYDSTSLIGGIKEKFLDAWSSIKNVFSYDNVSYFFDGVVSNIKNIFNGLGDIIGDSLGGTITSAINAVLGDVEWALNLLPNMFNDKLQTITDITGKTFSLFGTVSLPRLAKGGVVTSSMLANIGEDGAEAVVPLENNTQWLNEIAKRLTISMQTAGIAINAAAQKPTVINNNFYQTNNSPKSLSRLEIYRQSKNLLQLRGGY